MTSLRKLVMGALLALAGCAAPTLPESSFHHANASDQTEDGDESSLTLGDGDRPSASSAPGCGSAGIGPKDVNCNMQMTPAPAGPPAAQPIKASLSLTRHPDDASMTNCLKIQVNGGPLVDLGCNKGPLAANVTVDALAKPACNVVRLILFSNGTKNRTTESADNVARDFLITKVAKNSFAIQCNDNGDDDFNDLNLDISSADATLSIENTRFRCEL
jgi:hypothetical protein